MCFDAENIVFFTLFDTHDISFRQRHHSGLSSSSYWIHSPTEQQFMHTMQLRTVSHQTIPTTTKFHLSSIKSRIGVHRCMRLWTWCAQLLRQQTRFWHGQDRGIWVATHRLSHILGGFGEEWRWRCGRHRSSPTLSSKNKQNRSVIFLLFLSFPWDSCIFCETAHKNSQESKDFVALEKASRNPPCGMILNFWI